MTKATNFKFDERTTQLLNKLKEENYAASKSEVVRKALALLDIASKAHQKGDHLIIQSADGRSQREVLLW